LNRSKERPLAILRFVFLFTKRYQKDYQSYNYYVAAEWNINHQASSFSNEVQYIAANWIVKQGRANNQQGSLPKEFSLALNYPNPFNPQTTISYALPEQVHVKLTIDDVLGREVAILVDRHEEAGYKSVSFDASSLPSGVYFYRLTAGRYTDVKKMLLAK